MNDRIDSGAMVAEPMPSLADVAQEAGGAWPKGWYPAEIIQGYTAGGYTFDTADTVSKNGDSRNLRIALRVSSPSGRSDEDGNSVSAGATRNTFTSLNYRVEDLTAANVARVKEGNADTRLKIALGRLGQVEKALGLGFERHPEGHIMSARIVGHRVEVRLTIGDKGYNEVTAFRAVGSKAAGK